MSGINGAWVAQMFDEDMQKYHNGEYYSGTKIASAIKPSHTDSSTDAKEKIQYLRMLAASSSDEYMASLWRDAAKSLGVDFDEVEKEIKKSESENREREERRANEERAKMAEAAAQKKAADEAELAELKLLPNFGIF